MPVPSAPIAFSDINIEQGRNATASISLTDASNGVYQPINSGNASYPNSATPHSTFEWAGYEYCITLGSYTVQTTVPADYTDCAAYTGGSQTLYSNNCGVSSLPNGCAIQSSGCGGSAGYRAMTNNANYWSINTDGYIDGTGVCI